MYLGIIDTPGIHEAAAVAVARLDGITAALAVLIGADPKRRLGAVFRPPRLIRHQAEAPIAYGEGFGVVLSHHLSLFDGGQPRFSRPNGRAPFCSHSASPTGISGSGSAGSSTGVGC